jgi:hypothetical protein
MMRRREYRCKRNFFDADRQSIIMQRQKWNGIARVGEYAGSDARA